MAKGQIDKAIDEWHKLISESPNDGNIYNTIGDLLLKKNDLPKAVNAYLKGAEVFHAAGFSLKTIAIYKKLIKLDSSRLDILIKLGDLNAERGLTGNAIEDYLAAAKQYSQEGNVKEALEVYRKIADLDPSNTAIRMKLGELCLKEGLQKQAIDEFLKVADSYLKTNQTNEADLLFERILLLDPNNKEVRKMKGQEAPAQEVPSESQEVPPAEVLPSSEELLAQIDDSIEKGLYDKALNLLNQFMAQNPEDPAGPCKLGTVFLKTEKKDEAFEQFQEAADRYASRGEFGQAGKLLKDYLETDPDRIEANLKLADIYIKGNNPHLAVSSYAHVIDEYLASGEMTLAKELYVKIKELEPQHRDARRLRPICEMAEVSQPRNVEAVDTGRFTEAVPVPPSTPDISQTAPEPIYSPVETRPIVDSAALNSLLTEVEVYLKFGLSVKAIEQLHQVLAMDPDNELARQKLKDIYKSDGQTSKAIEQCLYLIEIYQRLGNQAGREAVLEEAKGLDPENPRIRELTDLSPVLESGRMNAILQEEPVESKSSPSALEGVGVGGEKVVEEPTQSESSSASLQDQEDLSEQMAEADFYYQQGLRDEAKKMYELILTLKQDHPAAIEKLESIAGEETIEREGKIQAPLKAKAADTVESVPGSPQNPEENPILSIPEPSALQKANVKSSEEDLLDDELEKSFAPFMGKEADESPVTENLVEPSKANDVELKVEPERVVKEGNISDKKIKSTSSPMKEVDDEFVDLSGIFDEEVHEDVKGPVPAVSAEDASVSEQLDNIFSEFQRDAEQVVDDIDYETHYNLGIAYKEMGLLTEAIVEFKQAMNASDRFIDASQMLSACHQENGNNQEAMESLERALSDSRCDETQGLWLRYDLASLYEKESRLEEALALFNAIARSDPKLKDVGQRVRNLESLLGKPGKKVQAPKDAEEEDEDLDVMMDRMFGESMPGTKSNKGKAGSKEDSKKKDRISYL